MYLKTAVVGMNNNRLPLDCIQTFQKISPTI
jgi:hypothetical protein